MCGKLNKIVCSSLRPWGPEQAAGPLCHLFLCLSVDKRKTSFVELLQRWNEMINMMCTGQWFYCCWVFLSLRQGFSISALLLFGAGCFFVVGECPMHCRMFSNIADLYPLDASSSPHSATCDTKDVSGQVGSWPPEVERYLMKPGVRFFIWSEMVWKSTWNERVTSI